MLLAFQILLAISLVGLFIWLYSFQRREERGAGEKRGRLIEQVRRVIHEDRLTADHHEGTVPIE